MVESWDHKEWPLWNSRDPSAQALRGQAMFPETTSVFGAQSSCVNTLPRYLIASRSDALVGYEAAKPQMSGSPHDKWWDYFQNSRGRTGQEIWRMIYVAMPLIHVSTFELCRSLHCWFHLAEGELPTAAALQEQGWGHILARLYSWRLQLKDSWTCYFLFWILR